MPYATVEQFLQRYPPSEVLALTTQDNPQATAPDAAVIQAALTDASAEIDGAISPRYHTPIDPSPDLTWLCLDIARYRLDVTRTEPRKDVLARAEFARQWLSDIADGIRHIPGATEARRSINTILVSSQPARFTAETLR